jgi:hypothetical protein
LADAQRAGGERRTIGLGRALSGCAFAAALCAAACAGGSTRIEVEEVPLAAPWTHLAVADDPSDFSFVVVGDRTGGHREGVFEAAVEAINRLHPAFVVSVGDLIEGETIDLAELSAEWSEFDAIVARLEAPFFRVPGNHDYTNPAMAGDWVRRFGRSYYHFLYKDVLFLALNSELLSSYANPGHPVEGGDAPSAQMRYVERVLAEHAGARWTFVLLHQPFWDTPGGNADWERVEALLGDRPYSVLAGHFHRYLKQIRHGREYITLGTTGGGSRLRGIDRGEFDHVMLVTVTDAGPAVANLMLEGIHGSDVFTEPMRDLVGALDVAVATEPLRAEGDLFRAGEQRFALENTAGQPITVRGSFPAGRDFALEPSELERTLDPGASEEVVVQVRAARPVPTARLAPSLARWTVEAQREARGLRSESTSWVIPERPFPVRAAPPVTVDAELGEWGPLRFALEKWPLEAGGTAAASLHFDVRRDGEYLYFAFAVRDGTPRYAADRVAQQQDGITVELDARPDPARSANAPFRASIQNGTIASLFVTTLNAVEPLPNPRLEALLAPHPAGVRRALRAQTDGYTAELAVPLGFLDERAGGAWQAFRLNVIVHDYGPDGTGHSFAWRPSRLSAPSVAIHGAGTFVRAD